MDNRTNTIAGWVLGSCMVAVAAGIAGHMIVQPIKAEKAGYPIEVAAEDGAAGPAVPDKPIGEMMAVADASHGAEVFKKCSACHTIAQGGANGIGPNLWATVGEGIAQGKAGYAFSAALTTAGAGKKWDFEQLNAWLTSPRTYANGTKMTFAGLASGKDRADVILYLNAQGSNLPLPAAPAGAPAATDAKVPPAAGAADPGGKASEPTTGIGSNTTAPAAAGK
ncbi:c-type cytochrome [Sphingomonas psychrolutea]|uniref:Cytochrome c n=1 Tax=Sphingomonas psychrolutea TaxID=1259676 RepID=A0ABQ1GXL5_9SPHN|nr:cytochrome c family protein [Sphingomonas psychrolutea]GGA52434.1 cytochrome c [Sphingomonas psychrolutea]